MARKKQPDIPLLPDLDAKTAAHVTAILDDVAIDPDAAVTTVKGKITAIERVIPDKELRPEGATLEAQAVALVITNQAQKENAGIFLHCVAAFRKKVAALCDPVCDAANFAHKQACKLRTALDASGKRAEEIAKAKYEAFDRAQEALRREEEMRRNAEAQKAAEAKQAEEAALLEAIGEDDAAEAVLYAPVVAAPVIIAQAPKPEGIARVERWVVEVIDAKLVPDEYKMLDMVKINGVARAMKQATNIPGIRAYDAGSVRVG